MTIDYDSGDYPACQAEVLKAGGWDDFPQAPGRGAQRGPLHRHRPRARRERHRPRTVRVRPGAHLAHRPRDGLHRRLRHGPGAAHRAGADRASELGIGVENINVVAGDTASVSLGLGGFASRQTVTAGSSVLLASKAVADKASKVASHLLEAAEHDLELADGEVRVVGAPQLSVKLGEIARILQGAPGYGFPPGVDPGLEANVMHRTDALDLCQRLPGRGGRGRCGNRRGADRALRRAAGLRHADQSDDGRRPGARRHRARHRQRAVRMDGLRRQRPAGDHDLRRLPAADRDRSADAGRRSTGRRPRRSIRSASRASARPARSRRRRRSSPRSRTRCRRSTCASAMFRCRRCGWWR